MSTEIVVALIGLLGSGLGACIGVIASTKLTDYRLEKLEKQIEKHNTLIERTYKLEERATLIEEKVKVANHRLDDLERGANIEQ